MASRQQRKAKTAEITLQTPDEVGKTTRAEAKTSARTLPVGKWQQFINSIKFMKTSTVRRTCHFRIKLPAYGGSYYVKKALKLEVALARKPRVIRIEMIGEGEIPADTALLIRSILMKRSPETKVVTDARSSLQGGSVLVWLLGDERIIREDARVFFKRNPLADEDPVEVYAGLGEAEQKYKDSYSSVDPDDADYARMLELINEFLPVNEFAGRVVNVNVLQDFGLVENERVDNLLATAFSKSGRATVFT
jgi:hypothetical protein